MTTPGFGSNSAFGGPCQTPHLEKLAAGGLKYNRFHTTALCLPLGRHLGLFDPKKREPEKVEVDVEQLRATILGRLARIAALEEQRAANQAMSPEQLQKFRQQWNWSSWRPPLPRRGPRPEYAPGSLEDQALHPDWTPQED